MEARLGHDYYHPDDMNSQSETQAEEYSLDGLMSPKSAAVRDLKYFIKDSLKCGDLFNDTLNTDDDFSDDFNGTAINGEVSDPQPLISTDVTKHDKIWMDNFSSPKNSNTGKSKDELSPPLKSLNVTQNDQLWDRDLNLLDVPSDSDGTGSISSNDTMILMTTEECQQNEDKIAKSMQKFKEIKVPAEPAVKSNILKKKKNVTFKDETDGAVVNPVKVKRVTFADSVVDKTDVKSNRQTGPKVKPNNNIERDTQKENDNNSKMSAVERLRQSKNPVASESKNKPAPLFKKMNETLRKEMKKEDEKSSFSINDRLKLLTMSRKDRIAAMEKKTEEKEMPPPAPEPNSKENDLDDLDSDADDDDNEMGNSTYELDDILDALDDDESSKDVKVPLDEDELSGQDVQKGINGRTEPLSENVKNQMSNGSVPVENAAVDSTGISTTQQPLRYPGSLYQQTTQNNRSKSLSSSNIDSIKPHDQVTVKQSRPQSEYATYAEIMTMLRDKARPKGLHNALLTSSLLRSSSTSSLASDTQSQSSYTDKDKEYQKPLGNQQNPELENDSTSNINNANKPVRQQQRHWYDELDQDSNSSSNEMDNVPQKQEEPSTSARNGTVEVTNKPYRGYLYSNSDANTQDSSNEPGMSYIHLAGPYKSRQQIKEMQNMSNSNDSFVQPVPNTMVGVGHDMNVLHKRPDTLLLPRTEQPIYDRKSPLPRTSPHQPSNQQMLTHPDRSHPYPKLSEGYVNAPDQKSAQYHNQYPRMQPSPNVERQAAPYQNSPTWPKTPNQLEDGHEPYKSPTSPNTANQQGLVPRPFQHPSSQTTVVGGNGHPHLRENQPQSPGTQPIMGVNSGYRHLDNKSFAGSPSTGKQSGVRHLPAKAPQPVKQTRLGLKILPALTSKGEEKQANIKQHPAMISPNVEKETSSQQHISWSPNLQTSPSMDHQYRGQAVDQNPKPIHTDTRPSIAQNPSQYPGTGQSRVDKPQVMNSYEGQQQRSPSMPNTENPPHTRQFDRQHSNENAYQRIRQDGGQQRLPSSSSVGSHGGVNHSQGPINSSGQQPHGSYQYDNQHFKTNFQAGTDPRQYNGQYYQPQAPPNVPQMPSPSSQSSYHTGLTRSDSFQQSRSNLRPSVGYASSSKINEMYFGNSMRRARPSTPNLLSPTEATPLPPPHPVPQQQTNSITPPRHHSEVGREENMPKNMRRESSTGVSAFNFDARPTKIEEEAMTRHGGVEGGGQRLTNGQFGQHPQYPQPYTNNDDYNPSRDRSYRYSGNYDYDRRTSYDRGPQPVNVGTNQYGNQHPPVGQNKYVTGEPRSGVGSYPYSQGEHGFSMGKNQYNDPYMANNMYPGSKYNTGQSYVGSPTEAYGPNSAPRPKLVRKPSNSGTFIQVCVENMPKLPPDWERGAPEGASSSPRSSNDSDNHMPFFQDAGPKSGVKVSEL